MTAEYNDALGRLPTAEVLAKLPFSQFVRIVGESATDASKRLLTLNDVKQLTGLSRSRIYRLIAQGDFPRPQRNTGGQGRPARWQAEKIYDWCSK